MRRWNRNCSADNRIEFKKILSNKSTALENLLEKDLAELPSERTLGHTRDSVIYSAACQAYDGQASVCKIKASLYAGQQRWLKGREPFCSTQLQWSRCLSAELNAFFRNSSKRKETVFNQFENATNRNFTSGCSSLTACHQSKFLDSWLPISTELINITR